ncbi:MAG: hypothetical protein V8S24_05295 [Gordonibacter pamelaeae]
MACEKGFPLFSDLLDEYNERHFVKYDGSFDTTTNVVAITNACLKRGFRPNGAFQLVEGFALYPKDYFCPKSYDTGIVSLTENSITIHHFNGSWLSEADREIDSRKHGIMAKHPSLPPKIASALAKVDYARDCRDYRPLVNSLGKYLPLRKNPIFLLGAVGMVNDDA